jgi:hypothetical protein
MKTWISGMAAAALWLAAGAALAESDVSLSGGVGYDSNVFDLNPVVGVQEGMFIGVDTSVEGTGKAARGWLKKADIGFSGEKFESGVGEGDRGRLYVRARAVSDEKYDENGWEWALRYQARDQTFISRLTGLVATDTLGNVIGDRYDSGAGDFRGEWRFPGWKLGRLSLEGMVMDRNYTHDYAQFGLERLDYLQYGAGAGYELGQGNGKFRLQLEARERAYKDRRVSDAAGNPVAGTDLVYRYYAADLRYRYRFPRRGAVALKGGYEIREDNGVGFADRTEWNAGVQWDWRFKDDSRLSIEGEYSSRTFDNQVVGDPTINDEMPDKKGFDARITYSRPFPFVDIRGFSLTADLRWESFDNNRDVRYTYDRMVALIGVRQEF